MEQNIEEIKKLMFTKVTGYYSGTPYTGVLVGFKNRVSNSYVIDRGLPDSHHESNYVYCDSIQPIKESKYRPYQNASEIPLDRIMVRYKCWAKGARAPISIDKEAVYTGTSSFVSFPEALHKMEWVDGSPFGVEVKE